MASPPWLVHTRVLLRPPTIFAGRAKKLIFTSGVLIKSPACKNRGIFVSGSTSENKTQCYEKSFIK